MIIFLYISTIQVAQEMDQLTTSKFDPEDDIADILEQFLCIPDKELEPVHVDKETLLYTALIVTARENGYDAAKQLLKKYDDHYKNLQPFHCLPVEENFTVLMHCVYTGQFTLVKKLLEGGKEKVDLESVKNSTSLESDYFHIWHKCIAAQELSVNSTIDEGSITCLMIASELGHIEVRSATFISQYPITTLLSQNSQHQIKMIIK